MQVKAGQLKIPAWAGVEAFEQIEDEHPWETRRVPFKN